MYVLDNNVAKELNGKTPDANVMAWFGSVDESDIYISVAVIVEQRRGIEREKKQRKANHAEIAASEKRLSAFVSEHWDRFLAVDNDVANEWGRLYGIKEAKFIDLLIAATANVKGYTVVTRNVKDFVSRTQNVIDPFKFNKRPAVKALSNGK